MRSQNSRRHDTLAARRLRNQAITGTARRAPAEAVAWLGAVQAQEYGPAKWALALRMDAGTRDGEIERAFNAGRILRTHVMRPTWHFVTPADIRWMLELTAPRVQVRMAPYNRRLELDAATLTRALSVIENALGNHGFLTRLELARHLADAGIAASSQRLAHIMMHAELECVICSGPRRGKQFTYALLAERASRASRLGRDEALGKLTRRYFQSHGPATVRDFVWWSGLLSSDAKRGLEIVRARPETSDGLTYWSLADAPSDDARDREAHLLPVYDEYLVAYRDRTAVPHMPPGLPAPVGRTAALRHSLIVSGQVVGLWWVAQAATGARIDVITARRLSRAEREWVRDAAARYATVVNTAVSLTFN